MTAREFWKEMDELIKAFRDEPNTEAEANLDIGAFGHAVADLVDDFESEDHEIALSAFPARTDTTGSTRR